MNDITYTFAHTSKDIHVVINAKNIGEAWTSLFEDIKGIRGKDWECINVLEGC